MEKLLKDVGTDILPGVSYMDHSGELLYSPAHKSCLNANIEAYVDVISVANILCVSLPVELKCFHIHSIQFSMLLFFCVVLKYNF